jgi:hypothetical protein
MNKNKTEFTIDDVISLFENPFIQNMSLLEYGKAIQTAVEYYVTNEVNKISQQTLLVDVSENETLIYEHQYQNNGPGFDRLYLPTKKKIQVKFRQVKGKKPYSQQVHFENTRRQSEKNKNESAKSGLVRYSINEFDYVIVVLCHVINGVRENDYKKWSFSIVPISELEDVNNLGYCLPHIPSSLLFKNYYDNIYMLTNKLSKGI